MDNQIKPNKLDLRFKTWTNKGMTTFYSITNKGVLKDFQPLRSKRLLEQNFYRYLQLRNYFDKCNKKHPIDLDDTILN